jgi:hypothetical protein
MKAYILAAALFSVITGSCQNQNISASKVPSIVVNKVQESYPGAKDVDWKKSKDNYEAEIQVNDSTEVSILVNTAGNKVMEKRDIRISEVPTEVTSALNSLYKDYKIDEADQIIKDGITYYQLELEAKGKKDINVVFNANGSEEKSMSYWD